MAAHHMGSPQPTRGRRSPYGAVATHVGAPQLASGHVSPSRVAASQLLDWSLGSPQHLLGGRSAHGAAAAHMGPTAHMGSPLSRQPSSSRHGKSVVAAAHIGWQNPRFVPQGTPQPRRNPCAVAAPHRVVLEPVANLARSSYHSIRCVDRPDPPGTPEANGAT